MPTKQRARLNSAAYSSETCPRAARKCGMASAKRPLRLRAIPACSSRSASEELACVCCSAEEGGGVSNACARATLDAPTAKSRDETSAHRPGSKITLCFSIPLLPGTLAFDNGNVAIDRKLAKPFRFSAGIRPLYFEPIHLRSLPQ